jgi:brefeldin A-resistance guanine nucleotide exchange factor 1
MSNDGLLREHLQSRTSSEEAIIKHDIPTITREPLRRNMEASFADNIERRPRGMAVSVAVDPVALITTECITVTSAMRKHARWAHSSVSAILGGSSSTTSPAFQSSRPSTPRDDLATRSSQKKPKSPIPTDGTEDDSLANRWGLRGKKGKSMQDNPLMAGFGRLRRELQGCKGG